MKGLLASLLPALLLHALTAGTPAAASRPAPAPRAERPVIVAHGGASGYLPEDTMAAYALAIDMGADFIEPTLYLTADGVAVARHQRALEATTNVAAVAAMSPLVQAYERGGSYNVDELPYERVRELTALARGGHELAAPGNGYIFGGEDYRVPSLRQILDYIHVLHRLTGRTVGLYPQLGTIPGPGAAAHDAALVDAVLAALRDPRYGGLFEGSLGNVFLQTPQREVARRIRSTSRLPVVLMAGCPAGASEARAIGQVAHGIAVGREALADDADCVDRSHEAGLLVHVRLLVAEPVAHALLHASAVDGIVAAHPDVGKAVRDTYYPLVPDDLAERPWTFVQGGGIALMAFEVRNDFGGDPAGTPFASLLGLALFQLPGCGAEEVAVAHPALRMQWRAASAGARRTRWTFTWTMPLAPRGSCFRAAATLKDGTTVERFFRVG